MWKVIVLNGVFTHVYCSFVVSCIGCFYHGCCRNLSLGLATKAKGLQSYGPRGSPRVTSHTLESVRKCEGVNPHTPNVTLTLGDGIPMDFQNFKE